MPHIIFIEKNGNYRNCDFTVGETVLVVAHRNKIDLEGACGGDMACSTCHVIVDRDWYEKLPKASRDENDMLDLAPGVMRLSRLGCQIRLTEALDGLIVSVA